MARRKRMTANQRRFFGKRATRRAVRRVGVARRSYRRTGGGGGIKSWLPLTTNEHISAAITGASAPIVMSYVRPYTDGMLSFLGDYKDEGATYIVGALANKFGSGLVKDVGQDYARLAVFSASGQLAGGLMGNTGAAPANSTGTNQGAFAW